MLVLITMFRLVMLVPITMFRLVMQIVMLMLANVRRTLRQVERHRAPSSGFCICKLISE